LKGRFRRTTKGVFDNQRPHCLSLLGQTATHHFDLLKRLGAQRPKHLCHHLCRQALPRPDMPQLFEPKQAYFDQIASLMSRMPIKGPQS